MPDETQMPLAKRVPCLPGLPEAKAFVRSLYPDADLVLFGSCARGDAKAGSDIDLCIVIDRADRRIVDIMTDFHQSLSVLLDRALDLVVFERETFDERKNAGASFERAIAEEGIAV